jgi:hypothetical protein
MRPGRCCRGAQSRRCETGQTARRKHFQPGYRTPATGLSVWKRPISQRRLSAACRVHRLQRRSSPMQTIGSSPLMIRLHRRWPTDRPGGAVGRRKMTVAAQQLVSASGLGWAGRSRSPPARPDIESAIEFLAQFVADIKFVAGPQVDLTIDKFVFESHPRLPLKIVLRTHSQHGFSRSDLVWRVTIQIVVHGVSARAGQRIRGHGSERSSASIYPPDNSAEPGPR